MCFPLTHSLYHVSGLGSSWHFSQTVKVSLCNRAFLLAVEYIVRLKTVCVTTKERERDINHVRKKIKMKRGCDYSKNLLEIDSIYIESSTDSGFVEKEDLYDYLKGHPGSVQVNIYPYPNVIPALSSRGEKYVRSAPDAYGDDDLLDLRACIRRELRWEKISMLRRTRVVDGR